MTATFKHSGDLGDIIYSLPTVRHFGGGDFWIAASNFTRVELTPNNWHGIDRLLARQPYIRSVRSYRMGEYAVFNLDSFRGPLNLALRKHEQMDKSLCDWVLETHNVPLTAKETAWLTVEPKTVAPVVINRTGAGRTRNACYHNFKFPWHKVWKKYGRDAVFIGTWAEYEMFCGSCGEVPYHETKDLLEAAQVIAGAKLFVGNQSVCHAIAQGLFQRVLLEVWVEGANSTFLREGVTNGFDEKVELPEI